MSLTITLVIIYYFYLKKREKIYYPSGKIETPQVNPLIICTICRKDVTEFDKDYIFCQNCKSKFHLDCITSRLKTSSACPNCGKKLSDEKIKDIEKYGFLGD